MGNVKEEAIQLIERMPNDCSIEDILYHLYVKKKVDQGLRDIEEGRVLSHDEMKARIRQWLS